MDSSLGNPVCFYRITFHAYRNASFLISYLLLFRCSMGIFPMNHDNTHTLGQESSVIILLLFQQHRPLVSAIFWLAPNEKSTRLISIFPAFSACHCGSMSCSFAFNSFATHEISNQSTLLRSTLCTLKPHLKRSEHQTYPISEDHHFIQHGHPY